MLFTSARLRQDQDREAALHCQAGGPASVHAECTAGTLVVIDDRHPLVSGSHGESDPVHDSKQLGTGGLPAATLADDRL